MHVFALLWNLDSPPQDILRELVFRWSSITKYECMSIGEVRKILQVSLSLIVLWICVALYRRKSIKYVCRITGCRELLFSSMRAMTLYVSVIAFDNAMYLAENGDGTNVSYQVLSLSPVAKPLRRLRPYYAGVGLYFHSAVRWGGVVHRSTW